MVELLVDAVVVLHAAQPVEARLGHLLAAGAGAAVVGVATGAAKRSALHAVAQ